MKKRVVVGVITAGAILFGFIGSSSNNRPPILDTAQTTKATSATKTTTEQVKAKPTCDGTTVTSGCTLEGANYKTYVYHPAVAEKTHSESVTTYQEKVTGYCTLCSDGSYSPSCATGRGACSHHGGVAQWNAPITSNVPVNSNKTVVDAPAQEAYYEKITE